ncbi:MAG: hypothetical protein AAF488_19165, partial [Planctomycetota bacterium]
MRSKVSKVSLAGSMLAFCMLLAPAVNAQVDFEDFFEENPVDTGWSIIGNALWVSQDGIECDELTVNAPDPLDPCTLYAEESDYILITPGQNAQVGAAWYVDDTFPVENLTIEAELELRDGTVAQPADGMAVLLLGSDIAPELPGGAGGAIGLTGLGEFPTLAFEMDNWNGGAADPSDNHW